MNIFLLFIIYILSFLLIIVLFYIINLSFLKVVPIVLPIILMVALLTLLERKILASIQRRRGPNVVGIWGLLQPFADAFKLIFKETIIPGLSNIILFIFAPIFTFSLALLNWSVIPFDYGKVITDINLGLVFLFAISSLSVYGIIFSGWSSNNKYALLGGLRASAQFISYEVCMSITIMPIIICVSSFNLTTIINFQSSIIFLIPFWPSFLMFFIAVLAETNRIPFDLPEAESELVSGYNTEYAATTFVLFFLAEYANIILMSALITILFLGGWVHSFIFSGWFYMILKICLILFLFIIVRGTLPRYRYDQLMNIGWKILLPISLSYFFIIALIFY